MKELKIVIAEDSEMLSRLLRRTLESVEGFRVVGVAADGVTALSPVREFLSTGANYFLDKSRLG